MYLELHRPSSTSVAVRFQRGSSTMLAPLPMALHVALAYMSGRGLDATGAGDDTTEATTDTSGSTDGGTSGVASTAPSAPAPAGGFSVDSLVFLKVLPKLRASNHKRAWLRILLVLPSKRMSQAAHLCECMRVCMWMDFCCRCCCCRFHSG